MLKRFGIEKCSPTSTPMCLKVQLKIDMNECVVDKTMYQSRVGALHHVVIMRRDIRYVVGCVRRYGSVPQQSHSIVAKGSQSIFNVLKILAFIFEEWWHFSYSLR